MLFCLFVVCEAGFGKKARGDDLQINHASWVRRAPVSHPIASCLFVNRKRAAVRADLAPIQGAQYPSAWCVVLYVCSGMTHALRTAHVHVHCVQWHVHVQWHVLRV